MSRVARDDGTNFETVTSKSKDTSPAARGQATPWKSTDPAPAGRAHLDAVQMSPLHEVTVTPAALTLMLKDPSATVVSTWPAPLTTVALPCSTDEGEMPLTWP